MRAHKSTSTTHTEMSSRRYISLWLCSNRITSISPLYPLPFPSLYTLSLLPSPSLYTLSLLPSPSFYTLSLLPLSTPSPFSLLPLSTPSPLSPLSSAPMPSQTPLIPPPSLHHGRTTYPREFLLQFKAMEVCKQPPKELENTECFKPFAFRDQPPM